MLNKNMLNKLLCQRHHKPLEQARNIILVLIIFRSESLFGKGSKKALLVGLYYNMDQQCQLPKGLLEGGAGPLSRKGLPKGLCYGPIPLQDNHVAPPKTKFCTVVKILTQQFVRRVSLVSLWSLLWLQQLLQGGSRQHHC